MSILLCCLMLSGPTAWTSWDAVRAVPDVDAAQVTWLQENATLEEVNEVRALAAGLSGPEAAQLLGSFVHMDATAHFLEPDLVAALARRPAAGEAGLVEVTANVLRTRKAILGFFESRAPGVFAMRFEGRPLTVPAGPPPEGAERLKLAIDAAPARTVLDLLQRGETRPAEIQRALDTPAFRALVQHRSQSFYRFVMTPEALAANIARAAAWTPVDRLWHAANRHAFLDLADVRANLDAYRRLLDELEAHEAELAAYAQRVLVPYLPPGVVVDRKVTLFFAGGSDGWASGGVAGLDVQYFKDRHERLLDTLVHETFHVAQGLAAPEGQPESSTPAARVREALFDEGTASFIAPPQRLAPDEQARRVARAVELLRELEGADEKRGGEIVNEGVRGAGPFYWLGLEMSRAIVEDGGPQALARTLTGGPPAFLDAWLAVSAKQAKPVVDPALVRRLLR